MRTKSDSIDDAGLCKPSKLPTVIEGAVDICQKYLGEDELFYVWDGTIFDNESELVRYDKLHLVLIYKQKGGLVVHRIPGMLTKNRHDEPCILYTTEPLMRPLDGPSRGRVQKYLAKGLDYESERADLKVKLTLSQFSTHDKELMGLAGLLATLVDYVPNGFSKYRSLEIPILYLTCQKDNTCVTKRNLVNETLAEARCDDLFPGTDRLGYRYSYVYGKGVIAAEPSCCGKWAITNLRTLDNSVVEICHEILFEVNP